VMKPLNKLMQEGLVRLKDVLILAFIFSALILCIGCNSKLSKADLVIINGAEPESLDPAIVTGQPDMRVVSALFEGLTRTDPETGKPIPGLAYKWDISPDGLVYKFYLRQNLKWSNNEDPITSEDVYWSWIRALDPMTASDYAGQLFCIKNAEAFNSGRLKDPSMVGICCLAPDVFVVTLNMPTPYLLDICSLPIASVVPTKIINRFGDRWLLSKNFPVSGPYQLEFWRINDRIRLRKNNVYWDASNVQVKTIDILPINSAITAFNLYETGYADIVWDKNLVPADLIDLLVQRPDFHSFDYLGTYFIRINTTRYPLNDPRVRMALAYTIDKQRIVSKITRAGEPVANSLTPPGTANYIPPSGLKFDPSVGLRLLKEAGFTNGINFPTLTYTVTASMAKYHEKIAIELQQIWKQYLGIDISIRQLEWKTFLAAQNSLDYDLCWSSWVADYNDAYTFLGLFESNSGNNRTGWKNPKYDEFLRLANTSQDSNQRLVYLQKAEEILLKEGVPIIPLYFYKGLNYFNPSKIQGIYPNPIDHHPLNAIRIISTNLSGNKLSIEPQKQSL